MLNQPNRFNHFDGAAHEPLAQVGQHFPASWEFVADQPIGSAAIQIRQALAVPCEITRLRAENEALWATISALRDGIRARRDLDEQIDELTAKLSAPAKPVAPIHRALAAKPRAFGLRLPSD